MGFSDGFVECESNEEYENFVDKFKPKLTTDDCYTPDVIYEAVLNWAVKRYNIKDGTPICRPFYPGGDYENYKYPENCIVIDNPPFSILAQICRFYNANNIKYFLFSDTRTIFGRGNIDGVQMVICDETVTFENSTGVNMSFVTNISDVFIEVSSELNKAIKEANETNLAKIKKQLPKYSYPNEVMTIATITTLARHNIDFKIDKKDTYFIRGLDSQKPHKKAIYGGGFLLSEKAATRAAAAVEAAEKAAAEKTAAKRAAEKAEAIVWQLSERELEIIKNLGKGGD